MKLAFFSPLPPAKSGIADYSAALLTELERLADVTPFPEKPACFDPDAFDVALYQIGNNAWHDFCYETALEHPGVVVIHEGNLHHLIADLTIRRGDWDAYLREVEFDAGPAALAYAQRVRALETGPDYDGVPMLRRLLQRSRGAIVHSHCVETELRQAGFTGPVARVPHGAWIPQADRLGYRWKLGLDEATPLIGIFGFLKPYKRIAESLRAFRRLLRVNPRARMILVGEPHPEFQLASLIDSLGLAAHVRTLGFTPIDDFVGYLAACDIVLNLRYPTVGENSGTLMRALGLGRAVIVSDVGSFREYPDDICLKVPVDSYEEDHLFEYLNLMVNRTDLRAQLGGRARDWVKRECNWPLVAQRYHCFLESVAGVPRSTGPCPVTAAPAAPPVEVPADYIRSWSARDATTYVEQHLTRLAKTLAITPPGGPNDRILEMGAYLQITPSLKTQLGYGEVRGCYYGPAGKTNIRTISTPDGEEFTCEIDLFDAEKDPFPYPDESYSTVLCCELIEHLAEDPMQMMSEVNRILKPGGHFVLTTPNLGSVRAISAILQGYHPGFFPAYIRPTAEGDEADARHNREYTPMEIRFLFRDAGLDLTLLETGAFRDQPKPEHEWVLELLERYLLPRDLRGDGIYAVGRKIGPVRDRYPTWLYS
jgi:glycosyltransferase involved in cell wall biosynthesis/SAM-dependent methyltransferase